MITVPEVVPNKELERSTAAWPERANLLTITTKAHYQSASELLKGVKSLQKEVKSSCKDIKAATQAAHKAAVAQEKGFLKPLLEAERTIKGKMAEWYTEQERIAAAAQRAAQEAADRAQEEAQIERAAQLEAEGKKEEAEAVIASPSQAPVIQAPTIEKTEGISMIERWSAEVVDMRAFLEGVLGGSIPIAAIEPNMKLLRKQAEALHDELHWPGVKVSKIKTVSARS